MHSISDRNVFSCLDISTRDRLKLFNEMFVRDKPVVQMSPNQPSYRSSTVAKRRTRILVFEKTKYISRHKKIGSNKSLQHSFNMVGGREMQKKALNNVLRNYKILDNNRFLGGDFSPNGGILS